MSETPWGPVSSGVYVGIGRFEGGPRRSYPLLREALLTGEFERGLAPALTGASERTARDVVADLLARGLLVSSSPRGPLRLGFLIDVVERWFPNLYPATTVPFGWETNNSLDVAAIVARQHDSRLRQAAYTASITATQAWHPGMSCKKDRD